jgi:hypothetical protein
LREEHRLRVFENRVMRRIFRPKRVEVTGEWRRTNFFICALHKNHSGDKIKKDGKIGACGTYGRQERCIHALSVET